MDIMDTFGIDRAIGHLIGYLFLFLVWFVWVPVGAYVASQKRRSVVEGTLLGFLGPFGVIVEALLPTNLPNN